MSSSVTVGNGSTDCCAPCDLSLSDEPVLVVLIGGRAALSFSALRSCKLLPDLLKDPFMRWGSSFQPDSWWKEPSIMSDSVGAFAATVPVAAMNPGGGEDSASFILAVRTRPTSEVVDALVDVRDRFAPGVVGVALDCVASGRGNGTGVAMLLFGEEAMAVNVGKSDSEACPR